MIDAVAGPPMWCTPRRGLACLFFVFRSGWCGVRGEGWAAGLNRSTRKSASLTALMFDGLA